MKKNKWYLAGTTLGIVISLFTITLAIRKTYEKLRF
jgi:hypothetical protein